MLRHLKGDGELNTDIEISERSVIGYITEHKGLHKELDTLVGLAVVEHRRAASAHMHIKQTEIRICGEVHAYLIGVEAELLMLEHMSYTSAYLGVREDIEIPFHGHDRAAHLLVRLELVIRHIVEVIVVAFVRTVSSHFGTCRSDTPEVEGELRSYHEVETLPFSAKEDRDIDIRHLGEVARLIDMHVHIKELGLGIHHRENDIERTHTIDIHLIHTFHTDREEEGVMEEAVVDTEKAVHTGRGLLSGNGMQDRRIAGIAVQGDEMVGLRRKARERTRERATQPQTYYE